MVIIIVDWLFWNRPKMMVLEPVVNLSILRGGCQNSMWELLTIEFDNNNSGQNQDKSNPRYQVKL